MAITNINPASVLYDDVHGWLNPGFMVPTTVTEFTFHDTVLEKDYKYTLTNGVWSLEEYVDAIDPAEFVLIVKTDNTGTSADDEFNIRITGENYEYKAGSNDWVEVASSVYNQATPLLAKFPSAGEHELRFRNIGGSTRRLQIYDGGDELKLREVKQWGNTIWTRLEYAFGGCVNMNIVATDAPVLSSVTSGTWGLVGMFQDCTGLTNGDGFAGWDTATIKIFQVMFMGCNNPLFNPAIQNFNTSGVESVSGYRTMLYNCVGFNRDISGFKANAQMSNASSMVRGTNMSTANYSRLLISFANQVFANNGPYNVDFSSQNGRTYDNTVHADLGEGNQFDNAVDARAYLVGGTAEWEIDGDSLAT